jgi:L-threonylcarbamoyladenylate synthase
MGKPMPRTFHLDATLHADVLRAADILRGGGLVAFPTETVYGLGANALSAEAVAKIFAAKDRPSWDPLIVHLAFAAQIGDIAAIPHELALRIAHLASAFWPGPLTLLLPRNAAVPDAVTAGRELVGVRVPAHPVAQALLLSAKVPVAAPSANLFGHTSPTTAAHVLADLNGRIDAVLDGGATPVGLESTVLDPTQTPMVLYRPGAITAAQLMQVTGVAVELYIAADEAEAPESMPAPGVTLRHYAPRATLQLVGPTVDALAHAVDQATDRYGMHKVGVLLPNDWGFIDGAVLTELWADWDDPSGLAAGLYAGLRTLDDRGALLIVCPLPEPGGLRDAIRDRLLKASR